MTINRTGENLKAVLTQTGADLEACLAQFPGLKAAEEYLRRANLDALALSKLHLPELKTAWAAELASRQILHMPGPPPRLTKDELQRMILESRYPYMREAQEVRSHFTNAIERARQVTELSMRLGIAQDDFLEETLRAMVPAGRRRLRALLAKIDPSC